MPSSTDDGEERESPLRRIIVVGSMVAFTGLLVICGVPNMEYKWRFAILFFPAVVWIPSMLCLEYGRRIDELLLGSKVLWAEYMGVSGMDFQADPNSKESIRALEKGRSMVLFGAVAIGHLTFGAAWTEHATCCTKMGPIRCLDMGLTFDASVMLLIYFGLGLVLKKRRAKHQSDLEHLNSPDAAGGPAPKGDGINGPKKGKAGPGFVLNLILIGNTQTLFTASYCRDELKNTALYIAPILFMLFVLIRGRPCHMLGLALALSFVFTPACLFRLEVGLREFVRGVVVNALGHTVSVVAFVLWARGKYEKAEVAKEIALENISNSASVGVDVAAATLRRRRGLDPQAAQEGTRNRRKRLSFMWRNRWHLIVIFVGLVIVCFPEAPEHIDKDKIGEAVRVNGSVHRALKEVVHHGRRMAARVGKGVEDAMAASLARLREKMHESLQQANGGKHAPCQGRSGEILMVLALALLQPAAEFICCCFRLRAATLFSSACWVPDRSRYTCNLVLFLGSIAVTLLTLTRDQAAYHLTTIEHIVVLAPPLCGSLLGLFGIVKEKTKAVREAFMERHGSHVGRICSSCYVVGGVTVGWMSPLALYVYPLAQGAKALGGCALFGEPFLADEVFVLADHHGYLMVLLLTLIVTMAVHCLLRSPPWRIIAQGVSSWAYFKVSVAFHLDDVKGTSAFGDLIFIAHVSSVVVTLLCCGTISKREKVKDDQQLAAELSSWARAPRTEPWEAARGNAVLRGGLQV